MKETAKEKTLHLTLKKQWFDMILSGDKKEEYREIKPYWIGRLSDIPKGYSNWDEGIKYFNTITLKNGYASDAPEMVIECKGIQIREGNPNWGAEEGKKYFVLSLGEILSTKNIK